MRVSSIEGFGRLTLARKSGREMDASVIGDLAGGLEEARQSLDSGAALAKLEALVRISGG